MPTAIHSGEDCPAANPDIQRGPGGETLQDTFLAVTVDMWSSIIRAPVSLSNNDRQKIARGRARSMINFALWCLQEHSQVEC